MFDVYRSRHNPAHYVAVLSEDVSDNADRIRTSPTLIFETIITDGRNLHLGFDPVVAKAAIRDRGFHAFSVTVQSRDHYE